MKNTVFFLFFGMIAGSPLANAGSATWNQSPTSDLWNIPENWTPATVPNGETDVASFGVSNITNILDGGATSLQDAETDLSAMVFGSGASAYTVTMMPGSDTTYSQILAFYGQGIVNDSGKIQNLVTQGAPGPEPHDPGAIAFLAS